MLTWSPVILTQLLEEKKTANGGALFSGEGFYVGNSAFANTDHKLAALLLQRPVEAWATNSAVVHKVYKPNLGLEKGKPMLLHEILANFSYAARRSGPQPCSTESVK